MLVVFWPTRFMSHNSGMGASSQAVLDALRAMAAAGASDRLIGEAVRELVAHQATLPSAPVLEQPLPRDTGPVPKASPLSADQADGAPRLGTWQNKPPSPASVRAPDAQAASTRLPVPGKAEIVTFRDSAGQRSSVSIAPREWQSICALFESPAEARTRIREVAATAPTDVNRSQWVVKTLLNK